MLKLFLSQGLFEAQKIFYTSYDVQELFRRTLLSFQKIFNSRIFSEFKKLVERDKMPYYRQ